MPFNKYLDVIRPILELYDNCDYEGAAILSRRELSEAEEIPLKVLLQTLLYHFEGHSRWESSYDYASARNLLKKADNVIQERMNICGELDQRGLLCFKCLNDAVEAAIDLENALIAVDANKMTDISNRLLDMATKGLELLDEMQPNDDNFPGWLLSQMRSWQMYGKGVSAYSRAMAALRTPQFEVISNASEEEILQCLVGIEEEGDEDSYSELASYLEFLRAHRDLVTTQNEYLIAKQSKLTWLFSFWGEPEQLNSIYNQLLTDGTRFVEDMKKIGITIQTIDEDSLSDLFETVLGEDKMKDLVVTLSPLSLNFRGEELDIRVGLRIYRYGIATIYLETYSDELTVSDLRVYLSFCGPHSAEYDIIWENRSYTRLSSVAEYIVSSLSKILGESSPDLHLRFVPHLNWYGYALVERGFWARSSKDDRLLSLVEVSTFPDYKGLLLGQMEARAALDDWILREPIGIRNLAPIRSHITDLLITTENHGILSFPDDPRWIILQYQETIETAVRLRCLISTFIEIAGEILDTFIEETSDLARELDSLDLDIAESRITETRRQLLPVIHFDTMAHMNIELIRGTLTSNYRDHAELMKEMMDDLNVDRMVHYLERRLGILSHHQTLFSDIATGVVERRAKEMEKKQAEMDNRRTQAMELVEIFISVLAIGEVLSILFNAIRSLQIVIDPILESLTYFASMSLMLLIILYIRRGGFGKEE